MDPSATHFWAGCEQGEFRYQRCAGCAELQYYPRPFCAKCGHEELTWHAAVGTGTVYSLTQIIRAPTPQFKKLVPYSLVLIDLDEGIRVMGHGAADLVIDCRVSLSFRVHQDKNLPYFVRG